MGHTAHALWHIGSAAATSETLTASYATGTNTIAQDISGISNIVLAIYYTPKTGQSSRNMTTKVEFSYDEGTTYGSLKKGVDADPTGGEIVTTTYDWVFKTPGATGGTQYIDRITIETGETGETKSAGPLLRVKVKEDGSADFGAASVLVSAMEFTS